MPQQAYFQDFPIQIRELEVERLYEKLRNTRIPNGEIVGDAQDHFGVPAVWITSLYNYWLNDFSWPRAQQRINQWRHYKALVFGHEIHFVHHRSTDLDAKPLLMLHGWPGSFYEFSEVITPLSSPEPGSGHPAFHVVVPSLLGFCWSPAAPRTFSIKAHAWLYNQLMIALGYEFYGVQAGDWGHFIARELGAQWSSNCRVVHVNYSPGKLPEGETMTANEAARHARGVDWRTNHIGYAVKMRTRPQTVAWMLTDNPVGLLAFIGEKYYEAASPEIRNTDEWKEHILTTVCLYYFTNCIGSSAMIYKENIRHEEFADYVMKPENWIKSSLGYTSMAYDTAPNFERAVAPTGNLVFYRERNNAGHFACLEDPNGLIKDIRDLVRDHWSAPTWAWLPQLMAALAANNFANNIVAAHVDGVDADEVMREEEDGDLSDRMAEIMIQDASVDEDVHEIMIDDEDVEDVEDVENM